jgi:hypothetical protein
MRSPRQQLTAALTRPVAARHARRFATAHARTAMPADFIQNTALTRRTALAAVAALVAAPRASFAADDLDDALFGAIAGAHRAEANRARDAARHPYQTLRFFGLAPHAHRAGGRARQRLVHRDPGALPA